MSIAASHGPSHCLKSESHIPCEAAYRDVGHEKKPCAQAPRPSPSPSPSPSRPWWICFRPPRLRPHLRPHPCPLRPHRPPRHLAGLGKWRRTARPRVVVEATTATHHISQFGLVRSAKKEAIICAGGCVCVVLSASMSSPRSSFILFSSTSGAGSWWLHGLAWGTKGEGNAASLEEMY